MSDGPGRRQRKKQATRDTIREAGMKLFFEKGYAATSLQDIVDAADVGRSTFYRHFETKEDLLLEDVHRFLADVEDALRRCAPELSPIDCHFQVIDELEPRWAEPPDPMTRSYREIYELGEKDANVVARFRWLVHQHVERVAQLFAERMHTPLPDLRPVLYAELSGMCFTVSLGLVWSGDGSQNPMEIREQILIELARGLDPEAVERRLARRRRNARPDTAN